MTSETAIQKIQKYLFILDEELFYIGKYISLHLLEEIRKLEITLSLIGPFGRTL